VTDRALQRSTAQVLSGIYEQDFLPCSFGGREGCNWSSTLHELGAEHLSSGKNQTELRKIKREISALKKRLNELQVRKTELERRVGK